MRDAPAHWIKGNEQARIPGRYVILAVKARREHDSRGDVQSWSLACVTFLEWTKAGTITTSSSRFADPMELWPAISSFTRVGRRTVVYGHNLNFDLRISQALSALPGLGWTLRDMRLDGKGSWSKWSREKASLTLCDSASIFPVKLQELAPMMGMQRPSAPKSPTREQLFEKCETDAAILTAAITRYVTWLRSGQCGNWRMTGASQSWSHWRHSHYTHKVLVHDTDSALIAERQAMYAGRTEAYAWGKQTKGPFYEYDWQNSYPRITRDCLLPSKLHGTITAPSPSSIDGLLKRYAVLAELEITTPVPCVPTKHNGRILWPTGTFGSTLWDPEIRLLREFGATFRVRRAWLYKRDPVLKDWAEWIITMLHTKDDSVEPWKKLILKHWSRTLPGRFGMRYKSWEHFGDAPDSRIWVSDLHNLDDGTSGELMQIGTELFTSGETKDVDDGCPQITSYIMSEARARLWRAYRSIGPENVLYVDTDSLLVNVAGHHRIQANSSDTLFDGLRSKGRYDKVHIYGPRAVILDTKPVVSGMPKASVSTGHGTFEADNWRTGMESIRTGEPNSVRIVARKYTLRYNQARRQFEADGTTTPYSLPRESPIDEHVTLPTRKERLRANGYPALLTHSAAKTNANGLV